MKNVMQCKELFDYNLAYAVCQYVVIKKKRLKKSGLKKEASPALRQSYMRRKCKSLDKSTYKYYNNFSMMKEE